MVPVPPVNGMFLSARSSSTRVTRLPCGKRHPHLLAADGIELAEPSAVHGGVRVVENVHGKAGLRLPRERLDHAVALRCVTGWVAPATQRMAFCSSRARSVWPLRHMVRSISPGK